MSCLILLEYTKIFLFGRCGAPAFSLRNLICSFLHFGFLQRHNHGLGESITDHSQAIKNGASAGLMFAGKFDGNHVAVTPSMLGNSQNPVESDNMSAGTRFKALDHHPGSANKAASVPIPLQQNFHNSVGRNSGIVQPQPRLMSDAENMASQSQLNLWRRSCPTDSNILNEQEELAIEGGTIHLSSVYSQGLEFVIHLILFAKFAIT